jgi:predicted DNA-binding protein
MYDLYIMKRTQIYLDDEQDRLLARRAKADGTTKSALIRQAIDRYLVSDEDEAFRLARFKAAAAAAFGIAPYLPDGATYVEEMRKADTEHMRQLDERWRG